MIRIIAIDWSGAAKRAADKIWIAEASDGDLLRLECGRDREQTAAWLIEQASHSEPPVVGMDFAFSFPAWFLQELGIESAPELWRRLHDGRYKEWLASCDPPFWGRAGSKCTIDRARRSRRTDNDHGAKSVFQIGGAGAVGTGSIRGMSVLHMLRNNGFRVWPFDDTVPNASTIVEIYPRAWSRGVVKSSGSHRAAFIAKPRFPRLSDGMRILAASNDDAFDAAISALAMDEHRSDLGALPCIADRISRLEGLIWPNTDS